MFAKVLIANRGEIACRIIRTVREMGISPVAVYSEADRGALHVAMADEAVFIGPAPAGESYLRTENIIEACRATGAEAVHPGYGFLSENAAFAEALDAAGITFIGPPSGAIRTMGDKIESKKAAQRAGVSIVPGSPGTIEDTEHAATVAREIGLPVMIKASAGGGGKGMRVAHTLDEVVEGFARARSEAKSSFGDDRVFIEKYIENPRHIEIQILADRYGNIVHLGERECSIQRRNQKIVEEAPSPLLDEKTRAEMGAQAVSLAKAVDYHSAGTVEFVADQNKNFYFLEMNTRLQVEHPVTELVTGIDLVDQMIRVAANERLHLKQSEVRLQGWAIESRIYAEDPYRNFLPSIGRIVRYEAPEEGPRPGGTTVRVDTGVQEGGDIAMYYDPMVAKLVTHGTDRPAAVAQMGRALDAFHISGIQHNMPFLSALMEHPRWQEGHLSTGFIAQEYPDGFHGRAVDDSNARLFAAVAAAVDHVDNLRRQAITGQLASGGYTFPAQRVVRFDSRQIRLRVTGEIPDFSVTFPSDDLHGEETLSLHSHWVPGRPVWSGTISGLPIHMQLRPTLTGFELAHRGVAVSADVFTLREAELSGLMPEKVRPDTSRMLLCPMPGLVVSIAVEEGQEVKAGETLAVIEAMKMENVLRAERDVVVARINAQPGDSLAVDAVIMEFE